MGFLKGKRALIIGVATDRSIAYGIAKSLAKYGAEIALTYQERVADRVKKCADNLGCKIVIPCDVEFDEQMDNAFEELSKHWDSFDILIHSIAYAPREALQGTYLESTTRETFLTAHDISTYSFTALVQRAKKYLRKDASILTLTYLGAMRAMPNYNVMGIAKAGLEASVRYLAASLGGEDIRVNAISSGAIKTLAASGIKDFGKFVEYTRSSSIIKRKVTIEEVGDCATFLCSDMSRAITGQVIYVDNGYSVYDNEEV